MVEKQFEGRRNDREDVVWRKAWRYAAVFTLLLHLVVVLLFRESTVIPDVAEAAAGERKGDDQAAAGGGMRALALRIEIPPPPEPIPRPPEPLPVPEETVVIEPPKEPPTPIPNSDPGTSADAGSGQGNASGPGTATGKGEGDGGQGDAGLYRVTPPTPRGLILPPSDRPGKVRGKEVVVYVFVSTRGRVVADSTRLAPSSGDSKFDDRLRRQASEWVFNPARRGGQVIAEWFKYTIVL